jgi:uncharacterized protein (TIGR00369 family)
MNDKPPAGDARAFDPASAGWEPVDPIGFGGLVGPLWRRQEGDEPRFGFVAAAKHLNFADIVHGGMLTTFADQAMGMTAHVATGYKPHATIELNVQFIGAVRAGEFVEARCEVVRITRAIIFMQTKLSVGARVVAAASGIWKIFGEN